MYHMIVWICMTALGPGLSCTGSEYSPWDLYVLDTHYVSCSISSADALGCTYYDKHRIEVASYYVEHSELKDGSSHSLLLHELFDAKCRCEWPVDLFWSQSRSS